MKYYFIPVCLFIAAACTYIEKQNINSDSVVNSIAPVDSNSFVFIQPDYIKPEQLIDYAQTLQGIQYKYASADPQQGFDCSGFITYVFNHFNIQVPRSSVDFTNAYPEVPLANAEQGDLVLFTGTDSTERTVGHMGIIVSNINDSIAFIHSTSGKANGVTITPLNAYYMSRFVKVVRMFPKR